MPLLGNAAQQAQVDDEDLDDDEVDGDGKESYKDMKARHAKSFNERRTLQRLAIAKYLRTLPPPLPKEIEDIIYSWENPKSGGNFGEPLFNKIFGASPKVGDRITLEEVFNKTFKGLDKMNELIKKWKARGVIVEYVYNPTVPRLSEYVIKAMD